MRPGAEEWYQELERSPEDWSVRLRLIEHAIGAGDVEEARRLVRTSPDDVALPEELKQRIHLLLSNSGASPSQFGGLPAAED